MKRQSGFSLVELAVVMVIIGLLATVVLSGRTVVESSETRAVMAEMRKHMQSFTQFSEKYRAYPGDMRNASTVLKGAVDAAVVAYPTTTAADYNGNGDNQVLWSAGDGTRAWFHLQAAGLADGTYKGTGTNAVVRSTIPGSNIGGGGYGYYMDYSSTMQNHLGLGGVQATGINNKAALTPVRAEGIDKKMDDGKPSNGYVQSTIGNGATNCINGTTGLYYTDLASAANNISCLMMVRLDE